MPDFLFGPVPHSEAVDFIAEKPVVSRDVFAQLLPELRSRAFTIAGVETADAVQAVRDRLAELPAGAVWDDVKKDIAAKIGPHLVNPDADPDEQDRQLNSSTRRAELLLRTHGFQAYQTAACEVQDRQKDVLPYWQYLSMHDSHVRHTHAALDGIVLPATSPFWIDHTGPWEWGCRCQRVALSKEDRDDVKAADARKPADQQRVLEGALLQELEQNNRLVRGPNQIVNVTRSTGDGAFSWRPGDRDLTVADLRGRYDARTFGAFESWARKTDIGSGRTVWSWIGGDAAPGPGNPPSPKRAAPAPAPTPAPQPLATRPQNGVAAAARVVQIFAERQAQADALQASVAAAQRQIADTTRQINALPFTAPERQRLWDQRTAELDARRVAQEAVEQYRQGSLDRVNTEVLYQPVADCTQFQTELRSRLDKSRKKAVLKGVDAFRRMTGPLGIASQQTIGVRATPKRAFYKAGEIYLTKYNDAGIVVHELAHHLELDPALNAKIRAFYLRRTAGFALRPLATITGNKSYKPTEMAREDLFLDAYAGKVYAGSAHTEILSMGLEWFYRDPLRLARDDADFFAFLFDLLNPPPPAP